MQQCNNEIHRKTRIVYVVIKCLGTGRSIFKLQVLKSRNSAMHCKCFTFLRDAVVDDVLSFQSMLLHGGRDNFHIMFTNE